MSNNNWYPLNNQSYYYGQMQTPATPAVNNSIIWVQGEAGAKSYLVAPNNTVQLWDSEANTIHLKSADASGMPSMKILDYKVRNTEQPQVTPQLQGNGAYVPRGCCFTVSVEYVNGTVNDPATTPTPLIQVVDGRLGITRIA